MLSGVPNGAQMLSIDLRGTGQKHDSGLGLHSPIMKVQIFLFMITPACFFHQGDKYGLDLSAGILMFPVLKFVLARIKSLYGLVY